MKGKLLALSLVAIALLALLNTRGADDESTWKTASHFAVEDHFKSSQEPVAKDALWTARQFFKVGVVDDGTARHGYALYVCEVLRDRGLANNITVHIVDIVKLAATGKWVKLGTANC